MSDRFTFSSAGLVHELEMAMDRAGGWNAALVKRMCEGNRLADIREYILGLAEIKTKQPQPTPELTDSIIHVDRSIRPVYPDWAKVVMHPELEAVGPAEYDLATVELWLHDEQKSGKWMKGEALYRYLKETESLKNCLGLHDAVEIQKKGIALFRKLFGGKAVFCWKSVVRNRFGYLHVPYVCGGGGEVVLYWDWLGSGWSAYGPAARFASI